ncbi:L,D-transpeptidase family protein [Nocardioides sp.]|uniref:L,D-transpeptidase family protein n=1 Tax=Nocardioides sp. TaxID=35761 RepID=UPI002622951E|nr:L,D-transpeptidase family protein [Nocardioides sp.]
MRRAVVVAAIIVSVSTWGGMALPAAEAAPSGAAAMQGRLNALGCDAGPEDGVVGSHTRSAIVRFQSRLGHRQSGTLTSTERTRLNAADAPRCDVRPVPAGTGSGRRIVISQQQNWIWLVAGSGKVVAQAGIVDNPAVLHRGRWHTGSYCGRPARVVKNQSGSVYMDNFVRFAPCGIGFHRIPTYKSSGRQMHPDWYLGTNLAGDSHGCVRVSLAMSRTIWSFTARGRTTVVVR